MNDRANGRAHTLAAAARSRLGAWVRNADTWVRGRPWYAAFNRWANRR